MLLSINLHVNYNVRMSDFNALGNYWWWP